ncbi:MAG: hypothetical protein ACK5LP_06565 [Campylobacteraceae bacterium]
MNNDFEVFKKEVSWFFKATDEFEVKEDSLKCSNNFKQTFPNMCELISHARVLNITHKRGDKVRDYKLLSWGEGASVCGWLCKFENGKTRIELLKEHQLLLDNMGGIAASYHQLTYDRELLTNNQTFIFTKSECTRGMEDWIEYYEEVCADEEYEMIETDYLLCFAKDKTGNETLYDLKTSEVFLFASEHDFDNVEVLDNQPEFTFYTINGVTSFVDYAENLAKQWLERFVNN